MAEPRTRAKAREREREIERQLQELKSSDPIVRRAAALYLGEAGAADAVGELIDIYETDEDKRVRKAAAYALGQFKAIDRALLRGRKQEVEKLLRRVEVEGRLGRRAPTASVLQIIVLLVVLLLILAAAYIFSPQIRAQFGEVAQVVQSVTAPRRDRPTLTRDVQAYFTSLRADSDALFADYQRLLSGQALTCSITFTNPPAYLIAPEDASANTDIAFVISRLNGIRTQLAEARIPYDEACAGTRTLTTADSGAVLQPLVAATQAFQALQSNLDAILGLPTATPTQNPGTPNPFAQASTGELVTLLSSIIEQMAGEGGAATLLAQYWGEAGATGSTTGCSAPPPAIPVNIALPEGLAAGSPNLTLAIEQVNNGLNATRNGWNQLVASCAENAVATQARAGVTNAQNAVASFGLARELISQVSSGQP
jgi:hypothetical protein